MSTISASDIISIIKSEIDDCQWDEQEREVGQVIEIGDGIATIYGIDHAMYGEIVVFENGMKGMVQDIRKNEIGVILFGKDTGIKENTKVKRTRKKAGIPVGDGFLGRVVNALGRWISSGGRRSAGNCRSPVGRYSIGNRNFGNRFDVSNRTGSKGADHRRPSDR